MKFATPLFVATVAMTALFVSDVDARRRYVARIPNGGNVTNTPAIGHPDGTGANHSTNAFGDDFHNAGSVWTKALCQMDSDGDGQTNGQELGDPCCLWNQTAYPVVLWTIGVTHPSDANKTSDPKLWAKVDCVWQAKNASMAMNSTAGTITFPPATNTTTNSTTNSPTTPTPTSTNTTTNNPSTQPPTSTPTSTNSTTSKPSTQPPTSTTTNSTTNSPTTPTPTSTNTTTNNPSTQPPTSTPEATIPVVKVCPY